MTTCDGCFKSIFDGDPFVTYGETGARICLACDRPRALRALPAQGFLALWDQAGIFSSPGEPEYFIERLIGWEETVDGEWNPISVSMEATGRWAGVAIEKGSNLARVFHESEPLAIDKWLQEFRDQYAADTAKAAAARAAKAKEKP